MGREGREMEVDGEVEQRSCEFLPAARQAMPHASELWTTNVDANCPLSTTASPPSPASPPRLPARHVCPAQVNWLQAACSSPTALCRPGIGPRLPHLCHQRVGTAPTQDQPARCARCKTRQRLYANQQGKCRRSITAPARLQCGH